MLESVSLVAEQAVSLRFYFSPEAETNSRRYQKGGTKGDGLERAKVMTS